MNTASVSRFPVLTQKISDRISIPFMILMFAAGTGLGAFVRVYVPFTPVPLTLQTFFVLAAGVVLGARWGAVSQLLYLFAGMLGLPIFAGGAFGAAYLAGPTGGYLIGFIPAALFVGYVYRRAQSQSHPAVWYAMILAVAIILIHVCGCLHLSRICGLSIRDALSAGSLPFIPGDLIKAAAVFSLMCRQKRSRGNA